MISERWHRLRLRHRIPPRLDIALAAAFLAIVAAAGLFSPNVGAPVPFLVVAGLSAVLLAWRRRFPLLVAIAVTAANLVVNPDGELSTRAELAARSATAAREGALSCT